MTQEQALAILKTGKNVFLTGEPGAGKTHTVNRYVRFLRSCGIEPSITASTGIAATHIGGMTIHSWSGIGIAKMLTGAEITDIAARDRVANRMRAAHVLIIDEISMLSSSTLSLVDRVVRKVRDTNAPFGGLQVVFVGDFFQLPPITRSGEELQQFAFTSDAWRAMNPTVCYLSEQHRQEDVVYLEVLSALRAGTLAPEHTARLEARRVLAPNLADITKLYPHNADVDRMNGERLAQLPGAGRSYAMTYHGARPLIEQLQRGCLSPEVLILKIGARVMFTRNNFEEGYVNGSTGEVIEFSHETTFPVVRLRSGKRIEARPEDWAIEVEGKILASISQLPLRLAWAITVHKSQGMSLDAAFIDLSGAFVAGQGYVALSRIRSLDGLFLGGINRRALEVDQEVLMYDREFRDQSTQAIHELAAIPATELTALQKMFVERCEGSIDANRFDNRPPKMQKKKERRYEHTLELIRAGMNIQDVAKERGRTPGTIIKHLEELRALGKLPVHELAHLREHSETEIREILGAFRMLGDEHLKPVFDYFKGRISYDTIQLARLFLEIPVR